jgi:branched-subunit amino acid transport protein
MSIDWTLSVIIGLAGVTVVTRGFFLISSTAWSLPKWADQGLKYAPVAALAAVVVPEIITTQGQIVNGLDARVFGAMAGAAAFYWRRNVLITIGVGMCVYLPLHLALGW